MNKRILKLIENLSISIREFEKNICVSNGTVCNFLNGKTKFSVNVLENISRKYPQFNMDWVITGRGQMLYNPSASVENFHQKKEETEVVSVPIEEYAKIVKKLGIVEYQLSQELKKNKSK